MKNAGRILFCFGLLAFIARGAEPFSLRRFTESEGTNNATIHVHADRRSPHPIPRFITGKFAEHLGFNIYGGMDAQILRNPTFADYPFWNGAMTPDGVTKFHVEDEKIAQELRRLASRFGAPESEFDHLVAARADGLAALWTRVGPRDKVRVNPDAGPHGRAQRVQVKAAGQGIAQWAYLPLHRVRKFEFEIVGRSPDLKELAVSLTLPVGAGQSESNRIMGSTMATGLGSDWTKLTGELEVPTDAPAEAAYRFEVTAPAAGQFVLAHMLVRPADHINGADPDVVKFLRESDLPILRWPGGNFVSTYHWEDAIGPTDQRPTKPNYAWGGLELNTFGTDEFIAFCRAVGCEPMICINAGSGTPAEAARWIEYCNAPVTTPMGARRAANGHPEPYNVKHWEVGNELWGRWQMGWTSASGYVDRFKEFSKAMLRADPAIHLYACGAPVMWGKNWNDTLIAGAARELGSTTDHPLIGGNVSRDADPLDVFRDFMAVPEVLERKWRDLERDMLDGGVKQPRLAVTELQMFARLGGTNANTSARLTHDNLVSPATLGEALYDVLIYHAAVRLSPFVEMVTHSATVNHGGGLRKEREHVWANPCYYAQASFAAFAGATPVEVEIESAAEHAPLVLPELKSATHEQKFSTIDALAAIGSDGALWLSLVHRGSGPIRTSVSVDHFRGAATAEVRTLSAEVPWAANTLEKPDAIKPRDTTTPVAAGSFILDVQPYSVVRVRVPAN